MTLLRFARKRAKNALRTGVGNGLGFYLIHFTMRTTGEDVFTEILHARKSLLVLAFAVYGGVVGVTAYRWSLLLKVQ